jgi:hypothetical protein
MVHRITCITLILGVVACPLWCSVAPCHAIILLGRWIGFTKGYNFEIPDDVDLNFDFLE